MKIQFGRAITRVGDPLEKIPLERLYAGIRKPKQAFRDFVLQLRAVRSLDERKYRQLKTQLPYFVGGIFHPAVRRRENFAHLRYFLLDLDHLAAGGFERPALAEQLRALPEVLLLFTSPGGDGLKVMFRLKEPCSDSGLFSGFYKVFARRFAEKNGLGEVVDFQTSDVTRACFVSYDPEAFFRPDATPVDLEAFLPALDFGEAEREIKQAEAFLKEKRAERTPPKKVGPANEVLLKIKQKLNPDYRQ
ncbi:MAG: virulence protein E, partial [Bacteroidetes bacterium]